MLPELTCQAGTEVTQMCTGSPACLLSKPKSLWAYSGAVGACTCQTAHATCPAGTKMNACLCRVEQADGGWTSSDAQSSWDQDSEDAGGDEKNFHPPPPPSVSWALTAVQPTCDGVCSYSATNIKPIYVGKAPDRLVAQAVCVACDATPPLQQAVTLQPAPQGALQPPQSSSQSFQQPTYQQAFQSPPSPQYFQQPPQTRAK